MIEALELLASHPWAAAAVAGVFGCCIGSFLNVCIWRMPRNESVVFAPSHCPKCGMNIRFYDNIPILSYILLGGKCRKCRRPISPRYWLVELLTGVLAFSLYALAVPAGGLPPATAVVWIAALPLTVAGGFIDAEHGIIPDRLTVPTGIAGVALAAAFPVNWGFDAGHRPEAAVTAAVWMLACWAVLSLFAFAGKKIFKREALGGGDVKYVAALAALCGVGAVFALAVGSLAGGVYGCVSALVRKDKLSASTVRFAPWLGVGFLAWCVIRAFGRIDL